MDDAESIVKHANNKKIANNLRDAFPHPYTPNDAKNWLKNIAPSNDLLFAIEVDGEAVGGIAVIINSDVYWRSAEVGYWLSEKHWNKGIVTEALQTLVQHTFNNTEIVRIFAGIFESNNTSARVLEKSGFELEAVHKKAVFKNGKLMNELLFVRFKEEK